MAIVKMGATKEFNKVELIGASTDTKPTTWGGLPLGNGSKFYESDTTKKYIYNGTAWVEEILKILMSGTAATTPSTPSSNSVISTASTNANLVRNSATTITAISISNLSASARYLKIYNKASAPTVGTDIPVLTIPLPATSFQNITYPYGYRLTNGFAFAITGAMGDSDTTAIGANEVKVCCAF